MDPGLVDVSDRLAVPAVNGLGVVVVVGHFLVVLGDVDGLEGGIRSETWQTNGQCFDDS